jgi:hypothetical protein
MTSIYAGAFGSFCHMRFERNSSRTALLRCLLAPAVS